MSKPTAIITKLEDCPEWLDRTLAKGYWEADYLLQSLDPNDRERWLFRLDHPFETLERWMQPFDIHSFAIITAFNPASVQLPLEENMRRHEQLRESLSAHARMLRDSTGQTPKGEWQEHGFWALNIDLLKAAEIGEAFGQLAIVCWKRKDPSAALWWLGSS